MKEQRNKILNNEEKEKFFDEYMSKNLGNEYKTDWLQHEFWTMKSDRTRKSLLHVYKNRDQLIYRLYY
jgi:hypothetical protein